MSTRNLLLLLSVLGLGIIIGLGIDRLFLKGLSPIGRPIRQGGYAFINPLLECDLGEEALSKRIISFRDTIEREIERHKQSSEIDDMSVYFRDMNSGTSFGVNSREGFSPASLLKLPVLMAYYKEAERDPAVLAKRLTYSEAQDRNLDENIRPDNPVKIGDEATIGEFLKRMIIQSDNNAMAVLVQNMPLSLQDQVYNDLGITVPGVRGTEDYMSVSEYASFFRILYNASYLSKEYSEKALRLLSEVDFADGIRAGVPEGVTVANKFGERAIGNVKQLHDCGIVYYNDRPYLICIMSRGNDFQKLAASIEDVSRVVYQEVDRQARE